MTNETKGRGGARANSGAKSSGIETVTVRIDKRLLNLVTTIKDRLKGGASIDDVHFGVPVSNDSKLLAKIAKLERDKVKASDELGNVQSSHDKEVKKLKQQISILNSALSLSQAASSERNAPKGFDDKLLKRLKQFCHPDKHQGENTKSIATDLMQELNGIKKHA